MASKTSDLSWTSELFIRALLFFSINGLLAWKEIGAIIINTIFFSRVFLWKKQKLFAFEKELRTSTEFCQLLKSGLHMQPRGGTPIKKVYG